MFVTGTGLRSGLKNRRSHGVVHQHQRRRARIVPNECPSCAKPLRLVGIEPHPKIPEIPPIPNRFERQASGRKSRFSVVGNCVPYQGSRSFLGISMGDRSGQQLASLSADRSSREEGDPRRSELRQDPDACRSLSTASVSRARSRRNGMAIQRFYPHAPGGNRP